VVEEWIEWLAGNAWFTMANGLSSIVSLGLVYLTWRRVQTIEETVLARVRMPTLLKQLRDKRHILSQLLGSFDNNTQEIGVALAEMRALLNSIAEKLPGGDKHEARRLIGMIEEFLGRRSIWRWMQGVRQGGIAHDSEEKCRKILEGISGLSESLKNRVAEDKLRVRDVS
jgi:hypothetical protein